VGISINSIKPAMVIIYDDEPYIVLDCNHVRLARGPAHCKAKLKNLKTSQIIDSTLRDSDNVQEADIEERKLEYLYHEEDVYHFLDLETYENIVCRKSLIEDKADWLKDNLKVTGLFFNNELMTFKLPATMELKVVETEPGFKGDSVKSGTKSAKLETGVSVAVPLFINNGDLIKVDTQSGQYLSRA
jgi:elongation factor P